MKRLVIAATLALAATTASANDVISYTTDASYDDVIFGLENAIIDAGLVVDAVSHVGEMLDRTRADVGSDVTIFSHADVYSFCSATVSREVMEADPMNIVFCPYDIFIMQRPGDEKVTIGFRDYPDGPMKKVQALLDGIAKSAIGKD
ncbi:DUF302 domain-containing protein [Aquicoccus sp. G2-2]|jgi:uncharacterized protein (DUF302 family)|uniref:DUF302 domain-containing protein n=1 Tax=Aquicoccus sp. G2-2 TaxID=3092120 RepID=UPI002AE02B1B|nr:DUF302 domain-containing protein [Aquicoccus sp. G2-2]MEA1115158.1 DUF302 domain-containing protein [Aquicoccus sp. G2-2]